MEEMKKLAEAIRQNPEILNGKSIILALADEKEADLIFMAGTYPALIQVMQVLIDDLSHRAAEEYLN